MALFLKFPSLQSDAELSKVFWLVRLRWVAILFFFLLTGPALAMGVLTRSTVLVFVGLIGFLFSFNLVTQAVFIRPRKRVSPHFIFFQLVLDLFVLSGLLIVSGGFTNPFVAMFLMNASLGGILISGRLSWAFIAIAHLLLGTLQWLFVSGSGLVLESTLLAYILVSHMLAFSFWIVMRSLGNYLEKQSEIHAQSRLHLERQDRLRALGSLAAGFSHEFASPLNSAKIRLERLKRLGANSNSAEDLEEALASVRACEQVIQQMNSSQLDARDFHLKSVRIRDLLTDILDSWREEHPSANLRVQIDCEETLRIPPINFAQVVLNLLDNAFESAPHSEIEIRFERVGGRYRLQVSDRGSGFAESVLERFGEPFVTTKVNGTGLGLYVSQLFSQSLGGDLRLVNGDEAGAKVILSWPTTSGLGGVS